MNDVSQHRRLQMYKWITHITDKASYDPLYLFQTYIKKGKD